MYKCHSRADYEVQVLRGPEEGLDNLLPQSKSEHCSSKLPKTSGLVDILEFKQAYTDKKAACDSEQNTMDDAACRIFSTSQEVCKDYSTCVLALKLKQVSFCQCDRAAESCWNSRGYDAATSSYAVDKASVQTQEAATADGIPLQFGELLLGLVCLRQVSMKNEWKALLQLECLLDVSRLGSTHEP